MTRSRDSAVRVGLVYPELLGTYGDRGNAVALVRRARWRGLPAEIIEVPAGASIPESLDAYVFGGGEDAPMLMAAAGMQASRGTIERARDNGAVILAICGGFQLIGHHYVAPDGAVLDGIGLVDVETRAGTGRLIGEVVARPLPSRHWSGPVPPRLTGFENHSGRTSLGAGVEPLGKVLAGGGNGDGSTTEGVLAHHLVGTYLHGPVLPRNPALADQLLSWIVGELAPLDSELELRLHHQRVHEGSAGGVRKWLQDRLAARG